MSNLTPTTWTLRSTATFILTSFLYLLFFYVLIFSLRNRLQDTRWEKPITILSIPLVFLGLLVDVFVNIGPATIVFFDLPREWTVTKRLQRYLTDPEDWRYPLALRICVVLEYYDHGHCGKNYPN